MLAYSYDQNGIYTGSGPCQRDPVRSAMEGRDCYLIPAFATEAAPPDFDPETQLARWNGEAWQIEDLPPAPEPESIETETGLSNLERLEAQIVYTAMMTDTLLEG